MRRTWWRGSIVMVVLAGLCVGADAPAVRVTLQRLTEKRIIDFTKDNDRFRGIERGIELTLRIEGPEVVSPRRYRDPKITQAVDDLGTDLNTGPDKSSFYHDTFHEFYKHRLVPDEKKPTGFELEAEINGRPPRNATALKIVTGQVDVLCGGTKKTISVKLKDQIGKPIDDADLKAIGITFKPLEPGKKAVGFGAASLPVEIEGDVALLEDVEIETAAGEKLNHGFSTVTGPGGFKSQGYSLRKAPGDGAMLKITFFAGQKLVTVPFKFENVKLP